MGHLVSIHTALKPLKKIGKIEIKFYDHFPKRIEVDRGGDKEDFIQNIAL